MHLSDLFGSVHSLLLFATTVFVVNATPGADMLLSFTNTMRHGVRGGLATALGISAGSLVHTALVALGVAALLAASPAAYAVLLWGGAAYLVWIAGSLLIEGWREPAAATMSDDEVMAQLRELRFDAAPTQSAAGSSTAAAAPTQAAAAPSGVDHRGPFVQGFVGNVLNPKVALFFLALLPQFVVPSAEPKWPALTLLGVWFAVQGFVFLAVFVRAVAVLRRWKPTPARRRGLYVVAAAALLLVAVRLVLVAPTPV